MYVLAELGVTPYVGVWIETRYVPNGACTRMSLLMWECGLKPQRYNFFIGLPPVTPYVGVWIETDSLTLDMSILPGHSLCGSVD